jgi:dihydroorotase (multifunctional complex type)
MPDLVIRNARLVLPEGVVRGEISVTEGKIERIAVTCAERGEREIDAKGRLVIPGVVDTELHLPAPRKIRRLVRTETAAASAGGVTTAVVSPDPLQISDAKDLRRTACAFRRASLIDLSLKAGPLTAGNLERMQEIFVCGPRFFKISTCSPNMLPNEKILEAMEKAKILGALLCVHAESEEVIHEAKEKWNGTDVSKLRPPRAEEKAVEDLLEKTRRMGAAVHFERMTTQKSCLLLAKAKREHLPVSCAVSVHHLAFSAEGSKPFLKIHPPLRSAEDVEALWRAISAGTVDVVSSCHFPAAREEVAALGPGEAPPGLPGVETLLPFMFEFGVKRGKITVELMVRVISTRPAQVFGLYPQKGILREESDADLVILDDSMRRVRSESLHGVSGWSPYEGIEMSGFPFMTILRGEVIFEKGEVVGKPSGGEILLRPC